MSWAERCWDTPGLDSGGKESGIEWCPTAIDVRKVAPLLLSASRLILGDDASKWAAVFDSTTREPNEALEGALVVSCCLPSSSSTKAEVERFVLVVGAEQGRLGAPSVVYYLDPQESGSLRVSEFASFCAGLCGSVLYLTRSRAIKALRTLGR